MGNQDNQKGAHSLSDEVEGNGSSSESTMPAPGEGLSAFVGKGVDFKGVITYEGTVQIEGCLDGEIHTGGALLVGKEAVIKGRVTAGTIVCRGKITGEILAEKRIELRIPAAVTGEVRTPLLLIQEGVLFNGTIEMGQGVHEEQRQKHFTLCADQDSL